MDIIEIRDLYLLLVSASITLLGFISIFLVFSFQAIDKYVDNRKPIIRKLLERRWKVDSYILIKIQEIGKKADYDYKSYFSQFGNSAVNHFVDEILLLREKRKVVLIGGLTIISIWSLSIMFYVLLLYISNYLLFTFALIIFLFFLFLTLLFIFYSVILCRMPWMSKIKVDNSKLINQSSLIKELYKHSFKNRRQILRENSLRSKLYKNRYEDVFDMIKFLPKNLLLFDAGCGDGVFISISKNDFPNIIGLDLSEDSLRYIRDMENDTGQSVLIQADIENLPIKNNALPIIISIETVEHLIDVERGIKEINRSNKLNGYFIFTVPSAFYYRNIYIAGKKSFFRGLMMALCSILKGYIEHSWVDENGGEYPHKIYWKWKIKKLIKRNGFKVKLVKYTPMIINSKSESFTEKLINVFTHNHLGELIIIFAQKKEEAYCV